MLCVASARHFSCAHSSFTSWLVSDRHIRLVDDPVESTPRLPHGHQVIVTRPPGYCPTATRLLPHGHQVIVTRPPGYCHTATWLLPHGHQVIATRPPGYCHTATRLLSHGHQVIATRPPGYFRMYFLLLLNSPVVAAAGVAVRTLDLIVVTMSNTHRASRL